MECWKPKGRQGATCENLKSDKREALVRLKLCNSRAFLSALEGSDENHCQVDTAAQKKHILLL